MIEKERRRRFALASGAGLALVAVIAVLANVLGHWFYLRLDFTSSRAYSLSNSSRRLVRDLEDPVVIKAYFSADLPAPYSLYAGYARDLLHEYRSASRGGVRLEFVPARDPAEFDLKAQEAGMVSLQFTQMASDQLQVRRGYMGLSIFYRDRMEALPVLDSIESLEYEITSRIVKMTRDRRKVIALTAGHGQPTRRIREARVVQDLSRLYDIKEVSLPLAATSQIEADALIVLSPALRVDDLSLWAIDQAVMRGMPTAFLIDSKRVFVRTFSVSPLMHGLGGFLERYGVRLGERLVLDPQCETVAMSQQAGYVSLTSNVRYPFVPVVNRFGPDHPLLRGLEAVAVPFASPVEPVPVPGVSFKPLFYSSPRSRTTVADLYSADPFNLPIPERGAPEGPFILAAVLEGVFPSYFSDKAPPARQTAAAKSPETSIFVMGTSQLLDPELPEFTGAGAFVTNLMMWLTKDEVLLGIRSKGEVFRPLKPVPRAVIAAVKGTCMAGMPTLLVFWGLFRWRRRKGRRRAAAAAYAQGGPVPCAS